MIPERKEGRQVAARLPTRAQVAAVATPGPSRLTPAQDGAFFRAHFRGDLVLRFWESEQSVMAKPKRTFQPHNTRRLRTHGFRARMATAGGAKVLKNRRRKGRVRLTVSIYQK